MKFRLVKQDVKDFCHSNHEVNTYSEALPDPNTLRIPIRYGSQYGTDPNTLRTPIRYGSQYANLHMTSENVNDKSNLNNLNYNFSFFYHENYVLILQIYFSDVIK
jgi:hypothetical protein